ncbi:PfkB domain protein [uncultured Pleomorphomonas sp.]|uniref:PfkB domain protein n=1 Tax=uncultured Pleomorphomonas sp. TaxID=442121 RepID=A0A212L1N7_9HYPH|nr:PfkB family carbohydrate kinase [uncultured Pleomorphomonas sp.]SCM71438.1 PfkB domain protein [uncultured Pleomorphomonas sp.]
MTARPLVTVFGSLHYDIMVDSPDRPRKGETLAGSAWFPKCGGKGGNQAVAAARAGVPAAMIGAVGDDDFGRALVANLDRRGVDRSHVRTLGSAGSGMSVAIFDADGDYGAVIVSGANLSLGEADVAAAADLLARTGVLVLQNEVPDAANAAIAAAARAAGGRVLLNAAPARPLSDALQRQVDILVVNAVEAADVSGREVAGPSDALAVAAELAGRFPHVVVTLGGDGLVYAGADKAPYALPAIPVRLASTHGAGDEFIGVLAAGLAQGKGIRVALEAANAAAAKLVATPESER